MSILKKVLEKFLQSMLKDWRKPTMKLSKNFYLSELVKSQVAERKGLDNTPDGVVQANLKGLCMNVLQKVRDHYGKPVVINSGYRSPAVNKAIGGSTTSQHCKGEAADFEIPGLDNKEVAKWIANNLSFDQLILEFYEEGKGKNSGWIHVSYKDLPDNRKSMLRAKRVNGKTKYFQTGMGF